MATNQPGRGREQRAFATVAEKVESVAQGIEADLKVLFLNFSRVDDGDLSSPGIVFIGADHVWRELTTEGKRLQGKVLGDYKKLCDLLRVLLTQRPSQELVEFNEARERVVEAIEQTNLTWYRTTDEAHQETAELIRKQRAFVVGLHSDSEDVVLIPDTNALILGSALEAWSFEGIPCFELCLVPTVLDELDKLKINGNEKARSKAKKVIAQVKEFRRRGPLTHGITVVAGKVTMRAIAIEPNVSLSLPWLNAGNADDRILASVVEVMRRNSRACVILVTHDINLQNKAEFALLPFIEPPRAEEVP